MKNKIKFTGTGKNHGINFVLTSQISQFSNCSPRIGFFISGCTTLPNGTSSFDILNEICSKLIVLVYLFTDECTVTTIFLKIIITVHKKSNKFTECFLTKNIWCLWRCHFILLIATQRLNFTKLSMVEVTNRKAGIDVFVFKGVDFHLGQLGQRNVPS